MNDTDLIKQYIDTPKTPSRLFYTYIWADPSDGIERYVGKGKKSRVWAHLKHKSNPRLHAMLNARLKSGYPLQPTQIFLPSEKEAFDLEIFFIAYYGRDDLKEGTLFNRTDGGEGGGTHARGKTYEDIYGVDRAQEIRQKHSAAIKGKPSPHRGRIGKKHSDSTRALMSEQRKGRKDTPEAIEKRRQGLLRSAAMKRESPEYVPPLSDGVMDKATRIRAENPEYKGISTRQLIEQGVLDLFTSTGKRKKDLF